MPKYATIDGQGFVTAFFDDAIHHASQIPAGAIEITDDAHAMLIRGQANGKLMKVAIDGTPSVVDRPAPSLAEIRAGLLRSIDATADAARLAVAGDPLRAAEYQIAEAEAKTYQAGGYVGECPPSVKSWAEAKSWATKQAADNIIAEAAAWNAALYAIRDARLKAKEGVRNALTAEDATAIAEAAITGIESKVKNLGNAAG